MCLCLHEDKSSDIILCKGGYFANRGKLFNCFIKFTQTRTITTLVLNSAHNCLQLPIKSTLPQIFIIIIRRTFYFQKIWILNYFPQPIHQQACGIMSEDNFRHCSFTCKGIQYLDILIFTICRPWSMLYSIVKNMPHPPPP